MATSSSFPQTFLPFSQAGWTVTPSGNNSGVNPGGWVCSRLFGFVQRQSSERWRLLHPGFGAVVRHVSHDKLPNAIGAYDEISSCGIRLSF